MEKEKAFLLWFDQLERKDVAIAGGKSSSLGELTSHVDVPVPYGFATTACAYRYFLKRPVCMKRSSFNCRSGRRQQRSAARGLR